MPWKLLVKYWDDFTWSVGFGMTAMDHTGQWAAYLFHEDVFWFGWNEWNIDHVQRHGVSAEEAEAVVINARRPFPLRRADDKRLVWGAATAGDGFRSCLSRTTRVQSM